MKVVLEVPLRQMAVMPRKGQQNPAYRVPPYHIKTPTLSQLLKKVWGFLCSYNKNFIKSVATLGIGPRFSASKAGVLPLDDMAISRLFCHIFRNLTTMLKLYL